MRNASCDVVVSEDEVLVPRPDDAIPQPQAEGRFQSLPPNGLHSRFPSKKSLRREVQSCHLLGVSSTEKGEQQPPHEPRAASPPSRKAFAATEWVDRATAKMMMEVAGKEAQENKKTRIVPRHILLAISKDEELGKLLDGVTIAHGGVVPKIHPELLPKKAVE
ncbi:hypothetical protein EJB05_26919, partial [Eragrostis curvula]